MYQLNKQVPCKEDENRNIARHRSSRVVALGGDDSARSGVTSATLDGVLGHGTADEDEDALDGTVSQRQSASEAAESAASVDC